MCSCAKYGDKTNCDDHIEGHDKFKEIKKSSVPLPTVMHNIDRPYIYLSEIVNLAPG